MKFQAKWIRASELLGDICPVFRKRWRIKENVKEAKLYITALGVYDVRVNGKRISSYVLAPGWTSYDKRLQYQTYDVTAYLDDSNEISVTLGKGWYASPMPGWLDTEDKKRRKERIPGILAELHIVYESGEEIIITDEQWEYTQSPVHFSEIYDGEKYDATVVLQNWKNAVPFEEPYDNLIPQEGEEVREVERIAVKKVLHTPAGGTVLDFGQNVTGYVEFSLDSEAGRTVRILHGEVLDRHGNFYNANYRSAKAEIQYVCRQGHQTWHPCLTFFGFRYIKLENFPEPVDKTQFLAVVVSSSMKRTGYLSSSDARLNQLFSNAFWSQKGNFLDVPTDCPQRDERLGWTGDAQVFIKTASYNYDIEKFFKKWLRDLAADQRADGAVGQVIPDYMPECEPSAAWGDIAAIGPWQIYMTYGDPLILKEQFPSMKKWVDYITSATTIPGLWTGGKHFGDWLGLDAKLGDYTGASRKDLIATAFYARSTELLVKAGQVLGKDMSFYESLYEKIKDHFRQEYPVYETQTECVLAVWFDLAGNCEGTVSKLAELIRKCGNHMETGFVGTPYILHVLSKHGYTKLAYELLLREEYPSWLFSIKQGATTIWEHWDGIREDGRFWSDDMNSFNHYSYGAVLDWVYEVAAGICPVQEKPGFEKVKVSPHPDSSLQWLDVLLKTRHGMVRSRWEYIQDGLRYEITVDMPATIVIEQREYEVLPGTYTYWGEEDI